MGDERLDEIDPTTGRVIGVMGRAEAHAEGRWHQVFHCLVVNPARRSVILQRRAATKRAFPSLLDFSATGHLEAGESALDGRRELAEELGLVVDGDDLIPLGTRLLMDDRGEGTNRELVHVFLVCDERRLEDYQCDPAEVDGVVEIGITALLEILDDHTVTRAAVECTSERLAEVQIGRKDLVVGENGYWVVLATMADRLVEGRRPLAI